MEEQLGTNWGKEISKVAKSKAAHTVDMNEPERAESSESSISKVLEKTQTSKMGTSDT